MTDRARIEQRSDLVGAGLMSVTSLLFGTVIVIQKVATEFDLSAWWILSIRFGIAAAVLAALLIVLGQPLMSARRERLPLVILGAGAYGVEASFFFLALNHGTASTTTLLFFTYPAMVAVGSMLLGRGAPGWLLGGALICAVAGAALVVSSSGGLAIDAWGVAFALAAAVVFSLYLLGADHLIRETNPLTAAMWVSGAAAGGLGVFSALVGDAVLPHGLEEWGPIAIMGVLTAVAFGCLLGGLRRLGPVRAAIIGSLEPAAGAALAVLFLDEQLHALTVIGGVMILAGTVAASLARRPTASQPAPI
jgi:drug/metabolite transporter (DMT)-like permease